jgi:hypothetical protein
MEETFYFFNFFFWTREIHILQVFWKHQACSILTPYKPRGEVLFKMGFKFIFPVFYEELLHAAMWLKLPKG